MLRQVENQITPGCLYLSSMPGGDSSLVDVQREVEEKGIDSVVSLAGIEEMRTKSPEYASAIENGSLGWNLVSFAVEDFGVPEDRAAYLKLANEIAGKLQEGKNILIHCGAGIGRSGTLAVCVLICLGMKQDKALELVYRARSGPENDEQRALIHWLASEEKRSQ